MKKLIENKDIILSVSNQCEPKNCRLRVIDASTTSLAWSPVYDAKGNLLNSDPNNIDYELRCDVCNRIWNVKTNHNGVISVDEWRPKFKESNMIRGYD